MNREAILQPVSESISDLQRIVLPALEAGQISDAGACLDMILARLELLHLTLSADNGGA